MTKLIHFLKKTSVAAVIMVAVATFSQDASACTYPIRGDVNNDGSVSSADFVALKRYMSGDKDSRVTVESADLDRNGVVNSSDIISMNKIMAGNDKSYFNVNGSNKIFYENQTFLDNGDYYGIMRADGNAVIYKRNNGKVIFSTGTNVGASAYKNHRIEFQTDGNIVVYGDRKSDGKKRVARWDSKTNLGTGDIYTAFLNKDGILEWTNVDLMVWSTDSNFKKNEEKLALSRVEADYEYATFQNAAVDFIMAYGEASIRENREYDSSICKRNGKYFLHWYQKYTDEETPDSKCGEVRTGFDGIGALLPRCAEVAAYVHTHGRWLCKGNIGFSNQDMDLARDYGNIVAYLGAPNGTIRKYDPKVDERKPDYESGRGIYGNAPIDN